GFDKKDTDSNELLASLESLLPQLNAVAKDHGLVLGIHSGDGKSPATLQCVAQSTDGNLWYKVSPDRQRILYKVLAESQPDTDGRRLFELLTEHLLTLVENRVNSTDKELAQNCTTALEEVRRNSGRIDAECKLIYDFGFLAARTLRPYLDNISDDIVQRYRRMDFEYINNLATNLGLI
ncbi:MAG: hypothetical protein GWP06_12075, partial [Actinobacteria bacterium]|nr:hypothetical protein [Actinomycetota bacterium]